MKVTPRRHIASWLLLAVFVPVVVLSSLHIHKPAAGQPEACVECVHHHCGGHIGVSTVAVHACVLCQFLTLPMLVAAECRVLPFVPRCKRICMAWHRGTTAAGSGVVGLRAPPVSIA